MAVALNHTIVWCNDQQKSADFLTGILGLPPARRFLHFLVVDLDNGVSLDFYQIEGDIRLQHYAFLIGEDDFDATYARVLARGLDYWADPMRQRPKEISHNDGGRGFYFDDPDGHFLEVLTRPYGSGG